jgi:lipopolysaccharide transport system ATP-binding protein
MMKRVISVCDVGKRYATYRSNLQRFGTWFGLPATPEREYWAVRGVSFDLREGEALALIGENGAGKSTLLKLITGTVRPSTGHVGVNGRISAILELGLGFNPEFTGRENIYHSGGLLGFSMEQLTQMMRQIEDFAEIGEFFEQPLRVYSSGMQARLGFALATAVKPNVLIVDEVLSVGDSYFQHKSFDRIRQFKKEGAAILLVTHSLGDVTALCDRVILLDKGKILKDGLPDEVVDYYNAMIAAKENAKLTIEQRRQKDGWLVSRSGSFQATVSSVELTDAATGEAVSTATVGQDLRLRIVVNAHKDIPNLVFGCLLRDRTGHVVWGTNTWHHKKPVSDVKKGEEISFVFTFRCTLGPGSYALTHALTASETHLSGNFEWTDNNVVFDVVNAHHPFFLGTNFVDVAMDILRTTDDG